MCMSATGASLLTILLAFFGGLHIYAYKNIPNYFSQGALRTEAIVFESIFVLIALGGVVVFIQQAFSAYNEIREICFVRQNQDKIKQIMLKIREIEIINMEKRLKLEKDVWKLEKKDLEKLTNTAQ